MTRSLAGTAVAASTSTVCQNGIFSDGSTPLGGSTCARGRSIAWYLGPTQVGTIQAFVSGGNSDAALRRALFLDAPRGWREAGVAEAEQRAAELLLPVARDLLPEHSETALRSGLMSALFAARAVFLAAAIHHPEELGSPTMLHRLRGAALGCLGLPPDLALVVNGSST